MAAAAFLKFGEPPKACSSSTSSTRHSLFGRRIALRRPRCSCCWPSLTAASSAASSFSPSFASSASSSSAASIASPSESSPELDDDGNSSKGKSEEELTAAVVTAHSVVKDAAANVSSSVHIFSPASSPSPPSSTTSPAFCVEEEEEREAAAAVVVVAVADAGPVAKRRRKGEVAAEDRRRSPRCHVRSGARGRGRVEQFYLTDEERRAIRRLQREEAAEKKRKAALEAAEAAFRQELGVSVAAAAAAAAAAGDGKEGEAMKSKALEGSIGGVEALKKEKRQKVGKEVQSKTWKGSMKLVKIPKIVKDGATVKPKASVTSLDSRKVVGRVREKVVKKSKPLEAGDAALTVPPAYKYRVRRRRALSKALEESKESVAASLMQLRPRLGVRAVSKALRRSNRHRRLKWKMEEACANATAANERVEGEAKEESCATDTESRGEKGKEGEDLCYYFRLPRRYTNPTQAPSNPPSRAPLSTAIAPVTTARPPRPPSLSWLAYTAHRLRLNRQRGPVQLWAPRLARWLYARPVKKFAAAASAAAAYPRIHAPLPPPPPPPSPPQASAKAAPNLHAIVDGLCGPEANPFLHSWERASWVTRAAFLGDSGASQRRPRGRMTVRRQQRQQCCQEVFMLW